MNEIKNDLRTLQDNSFSERDFLYKNNSFSVLIGKGKYSKRDEAENFIKKKFNEIYAAKIAVSYPILMSIKQNGKIIAALGIRLAGAEKLFLENYLETALEDQLTSIAKTKVTRNQFAEVGNLATEAAQGIRLIIIACVSCLRESGCDYISFTGTDALYRYFTALGFFPTIIADAIPTKIEDVSAWGSYYQSHPKVIIENIAASYPQLIERFGIFFVHKDLKNCSQFA